MVVIPIQVIADSCRPASDAATIDRLGDYALVIESYALATHGEVPRVVPTASSSKRSISLPTHPAHGPFPPPARVARPKCLPSGSQRPALLH
jgi:hypothetical protein